MNTTMKKIAMYFGAAFLGGVCAFLLFKAGQSTNVNISDSAAVQMENCNARSTAYYDAAQAGRGMQGDFVEASAKVMPTVVHIATKTTVRSSAVPPGMEMWQEFFGPNWQFPQQERSNVRQGTGSGVIVQPNGYIVTNNHVITGADEITVTLHDQRSFTAKVVGADPNTDIALIKIDADSLPIITFANSDDVQVGEWVLAVGNPFNLNSTVTAGIVSAKGRNINILQQKYAIEAFIQTDAAINPGNSGGALTNAVGDLIGINTAIASPTGAYSGYGFAVPSNIVLKIMSDLKQYGVVQRGFLGVSIRTVDAELVKNNSLKVRQGVFVEEVLPSGAAEKAGLKKEDVIVKVDNVAVASVADLQGIIGRHAPGDKVNVTVNRKGTEKVFTLTLTNASGGETVTTKATVDVLANLGISIQNAPEKTLKAIGKPSGVEVTAIQEGIIQKHTTMRSGFIITKVDNTVIKTADQFTDLMKDKTGGVMIEGMYPNLPGVFYYAFGM
ncbi:MAG: Do family serine endopeptidase [Bacteroidales bacterium]|jgi:Do/DeqQ family serine protease|nr:Do family serine endopeptidase [Bacteroidales bacterium]